MLTRKDFRKIASEIATVQDERERKALAKIMGEVGAKSNPRFNWAIWNSACKVQ